jgi:NADPH-dependent glutamate synthase beta subunit-like oxidoreductase
MFCGEIKMKYEQYVLLIQTMTDQQLIDTKENINKKRWENEQIDRWSKDDRDYDNMLWDQIKAINYEQLKRIEIDLNAQGRREMAEANILIRISS